MELTSTQLTEAADDVVCSCRPVQTLTAGPACKLLTKNAIFQSPEDDGSILVCAGDEASNSAMVLPCPCCRCGAFCFSLLGWNAGGLTSGLTKFNYMSFGSWFFLCLKKSVILKSLEVGYPWRGGLSPCFWGNVSGEEDVALICVFREFFSCANSIACKRGSPAFPETECYMRECLVFCCWNSSFSMHVHSISSLASLL